AIASKPATTLDQYRLQILRTTANPVGAGLLAIAAAQSISMSPDTTHTLMPLIHTLYELPKAAIF
ncbi:MAG: hypothetical protein AAAB17_24170, partial [Pseudomonas sp.]